MVLRWQQNISDPVGDAREESAATTLTPLGASNEFIHSRTCRAATRLRVLASFPESGLRGAKLTARNCVSQRGV